MSAPRGAPAKPKEKNNLTILLLGSGRTGKTTMLTSHLFNIFTSYHDPTFEHVFLGPGRGPGNESFPPVKQVTYLDVGTSQDFVERFYDTRIAMTDMIILVFSLIDKSSLEDVVHHWWPLAQPHRKPMILVGTKKELRSLNIPIGDSREVLQVEGIRAAANIGAKWYGECSALTEEGLKDVFENAVRVGMGERPADRMGVLGGTFAPTVANHR
jgi:GTPase SAR1 family protein